VLPVVSLSNREEVVRQAVARHLELEAGDASISQDEIQRNDARQRGVGRDPGDPVGRATEDRVATIAFMATATIYLVRHGETEWNVAGRLQGHLDSPLTVNGVGHARHVGRVLRRLLPADVERSVESSDLGRAVRTAQILCEELALDPALCVSEPLLREHAMGQWEGLTVAERDRRFPGAHVARSADPWRSVVPGGESYELACRRAAAWLARPRPTPITIVVTHEMMSRTIQSVYAGLDPTTTLALSHPHAQIVCLASGRRSVVDAQ
jgi:broad specificity phosphatase PhoE